MKKQNPVLRFLGNGFSPKLICILSACAYFALIAPIAYIGKYDAPAADDFWYGRFVHEYIAGGGRNPAGVLLAACRQVAVSYKTWQGTFSSIFLMALSPSAFDWRLYKLVPAFIMAGMTAACFALSHTLLRRGLRFSVWESLSVGFLSSVLVIEKVYSIPQGMFWYNGAVHYMFMQAVSFLYVACLVRLLQGFRKKSGKRLFLFLGVFLGMMTGGSNYATIPMLVVLLALFFLIAYGQKKKQLYLLISPVAAFLLASVVNMAAPGNAVRAVHYAGLGMPAHQAVLRSLAEGVGFLPKYFDVFTLLMLVLLFPVLWNGLRAAPRFSFCYPVLFTLLSYCVMCAGFTSSLYTGGGLLISRLLNSVRFMFQVLLIANEVYWIGWLRNLLKNRAAGFWKKREQLPVSPVFVCVIGLLMYATVHFHHNPLGTFTTWAAWYHLKIGDAALYYQECMTRQTVYENSAGEDVVVEPFHHRPWLLLAFDITEDPEHYDNQHVKNYYGLQSVRLRQ